MEERLMCCDCVYYPNSLACDDCEGYSNLIEHKNYIQKIEIPTEKLIKMQEIVKAQQEVREAHKELERLQKLQRTWYQRLWDWLCHL